MEIVFQTQKMPASRSADEDFVNSATINTFEQI